MKAMLLFSLFITMIFTTGYAGTADQDVDRIYLIQDESGEFILELPENVVMGDVHCDKNGYFVYFDECIPKAFRRDKKFYCRCGGKFFRRHAFLRHKCPYRNNID